MNSLLRQSRAAAHHRVLQSGADCGHVQRNPPGPDGAHARPVRQLRDPEHGESDSEH